MSTISQPMTKGERTRARILVAAERVFAELGFHDASIVKITEAAGVGQGTFYLYFTSKIEIFDEVVEDLNRRVRHAMIAASSQATGRIEAERAGFRAFFEFTAEHPALYRIVRQAEFVSPGALRLHYTRIVEGYEAGLRQAQQTGDVDPRLDPAVAAWALMGMGELIGMRFLLWERDAEGRPPAELDPAVFDAMARFIDNALAPRGAEEGEQE